MKIIKEAPDKETWTDRIECPCCKAVLEIDAEDVRASCRNKTGLYTMHLGCKVCDVVINLFSVPEMVRRHAIEKARKLIRR